MTEYLMNFFKALRSLEQDRPDWVSDGIAYDEGSLYVLVGMGDVRVRVPMREFDHDPAKAAEVAYKPPTVEEPCYQLNKGFLCGVR
jgi:hypothetical protein